MTGNQEYAYVTNIAGVNRDWPRCGNTFNTGDILGYNPNKTNKLQEGFEVGDVLVQYNDGVAVKIIETRKDELVRHEVKAITEEEKKTHAKSLRHVERELRYQKNSYVMKRHIVKELLEKHDTVALANIITRSATDKYLEQLASTALITLGYVAIILPTRYDLLKGGHKAYPIKPETKLVGANNDEDLAG